MIEIIVKSQFDCSKQRCFVCRHHSDNYDCRLRERASKQAYALIKAGYGDVSEYKEKIQSLKNNEIVTIKTCNQIVRDTYRKTQAELKQASDKINLLQDSIKEKDAEIKRLKEVVKNYKEVLCETTQRKDDATKLNDTLVEEYENKIKQSQIDVLNKVKEQVFHGVSLFFLQLYIDELIKEIEK